MKHHVRLVAASIAITLLASSTLASVASGAAVFTDVPTNHPFVVQITWIADEGIGGGYPDGTFRPSLPITRQAMANFLWRYAGEPSPTVGGTVSFPDVPPSHAFYDAISWLASSGVAGGYADGGFHPADPITRQAMAMFLWRYSGQPAAGAGAPTFNDVTVANPFYGAIRWLASTEVTTGYPSGDFFPTDPITRQAMSAFLWRLDRLGATERANLTTAGAQAVGGNSSGAAISGDGRFVAFQSESASLVSDSNAAMDVFVRDRQLGTTSRVSVGSGGVQATGGASFSPAISDNGRFVAFESTATNLVAGDSNGLRDVFVHDREANLTTRVSVASGGSQATGGHSSEASISDDGRFVAFVSSATNLVTGDTNGQTDIFLHDRNTGTTTRVSVTSTGTQATGGFSSQAAIAGGGRYIAYTSTATNLVTSDSNGLPDVFVYDRSTGSTTRASLGVGAVQALGGSSLSPILSDSGRHIVFFSNATNLVGGDTNAASDIFVRDLIGGGIRRVSIATDRSQAAGGTSQYPYISGEGRYVVYTSSATNLVEGDTNAATDIFVHDRGTGVTSRASLGANGAQIVTGSSVALPVVSDDGHFITFSSTATNLVSGDSNGYSDIFVRNRFGVTP